MMSRNKVYDAIAIIFDIGKSVSRLNDGEDKSFFERSKECLSWILQRKLMSDSQDLISLIVIGAEDSENGLNEDGYDNISCKFDFQLASVQMLQYVETQARPTNKNSDWIGGITAVLNKFKSQDELEGAANRQMVIFSDFTYHIPDDINIIIRNIKAMEVEVTVIGLNIPDLEFRDANGEPSTKKRRAEHKTQERLRGEKLVGGMLSELGDLMRVSTFEHALKQLSHYTRKKIRATPWNCVLDIGSLGINISAFKKTDIKVPNTFKLKYMRPQDNNQPSTSVASTQHFLASTSAGAIESENMADVVRDKVMHYQHQDETTKEIEEIAVQQDDIIEGFRYGSTIIPFSEEDKSVLGYKAGPKCLSVIGFTKMSNVPYYLLSGEAVYTVASRDRDEAAEVAFSAIVQAMKEEECIAIARRVYADNRGLSIGILFPLTEEIQSSGDEEASAHKECLLFIELSFKEEVRSINFPSLEPVSKAITSQQFKIVDRLIDEMDLTTAERNLNDEPCEALETSCLHDVKKQFSQYCILQRAVHPRKPISKELPPHIREYISLPKSLQEKNKSLGLELKKYFTMKIKEEKPDRSVFANHLKGIFTKAEAGKEDSKSKIDDIFGNAPNEPNESQMESLGAASNGTDESIEHAGTATPDDSIHESNGTSLSTDFHKLFKDQHFPSATAVINIFTFYLEDIGTEKTEVTRHFQAAMIETRRKCIEKRWEEYNKWVREFKRFLVNRGGIGFDIWCAITSADLGLITRKENSLSSCSEEEANEFIRPESISNSIRKSLSHKDIPDFAPISESNDQIQNERNEAMDLLF